MLNEEKLNIILEKTIGNIVRRVFNDFIKKELIIYFEDEKSITFIDCAFVYDLGIVGIRIGDFSKDAGLGMKLELEKSTVNSEEYLYCTLAKDFKDYNNKNEIRISFKSIESNL